MCSQRTYYSVLPYLVCSIPTADWLFSGNNGSSFVCACYHATIGSRAKTSSQINARYFEVCGTLFTQNHTGPVSYLVQYVTSTAKYPWYPVYKTYDTRTSIFLKKRNNSRRREVNKLMMVSFLLSTWYALTAVYSYSDIPYRVQLSTYVNF